MKTVLAMALILAILPTLAFADDKNAPPVPIHQPEPEWPPELSKSYLVNPTKVTMILDQRGVPFSLSGDGLPDNVVTTLAEWRFRPGKKDGTAVPFSETFVIPARTALNASSERALRRRAYYLSKTIQAALQSGSGLDIGGAEALERSLATDLNNIDIRGQLLVFSIESARADAKGAAERRARHIEFLVQNLPEEQVLASPLSLINKTAGPLADVEGYSRIRDLWLMQLAAKPDDSVILEHATYFLRVSDPEKTEQLLLPAMKELPEASIWLGDLYGLSALGVDGVDLKTGLAVSTSPSLAPLAQKAREILLGMNNPKILLSALNTMASHAHALAQIDALPDGYAAFCNQLLSRAKSFYPETAMTCDPSVDVPDPQQEVMRIRVGGNVQQAHLTKKVAPVYPLDAKARGIQGVVRFTAIIDTDGSIKNLSLVSGPLALYKSAYNAVRQWVYKPTMLNGKPVEVVTTLEVNYTLSR